MFRRKDPQTSKDGAASVRHRVSMYEGRVLHVLGKSEISLTANEIAFVAYPTQRIQCESVRKRVTIMAKRGRLKCVGERRCSVTGCVARVYEVVQ